MCVLWCWTTGVENKKKRGPQKDCWFTLSRSTFCSKVHCVFLHFPFSPLILLQQQLTLFFYCSSHSLAPRTFLALLLSFTTFVSRRRKSLFLAQRKETIKANGDLHLQTFFSFFLKKFSSILTTPDSSLNSDFDLLWTRKWNEREVRRIKCRATPCQQPVRTWFILASETIFLDVSPPMYERNGSNLYVKGHPNSWVSVKIQEIAACPETVMLCRQQHQGEIESKEGTKKEKSRLLFCNQVGVWGLLRFLAWLRFYGGVHCRHFLYFTPFFSFSFRGNGSLNTQEIILHNSLN